MDAPDERLPTGALIRSLDQLAYTVAQAAQVIGLPEQSVRLLIGRGAIKAKRTHHHPETGIPSGRMLVLRSELEAWLEGLPDQHELWWHLRREPATKPAPEPPIDLDAKPPTVVATELISLADAADRIGRTPWDVHRLIDRGKLAGTEIGGRMYVNPAAVDRCR